MALKSLIKKLIPELLLLWYHWVLAYAAAIRYGFPSRSMIVIGITGTKGKTSAAHLIWSVLNTAGYKTGLTSTAGFKIGDHPIPNPYHMTMIGPFQLQRLLARMKRAGCTHCIVETTSEGMKQWRHKGIWYDLVIFTNLFPEHLQSHGGSFETYKMVKGRLFESLMNHPQKNIHGNRILRTTIVNLDSPHASYYLDFPADQKITYGLDSAAKFVASNTQERGDGVTFSADSHPYHLRLVGTFNVLNALPAIAAGKALGINEDIIARGLEAVLCIPGRMERVDEGQKFSVFVDYAHENEGLNTVLDVGRRLAGNHRLIVLTGSQGGGRDVAKRPLMGASAGKKADYVVVANEDPYNDNPEQIINEVAGAAESAGKRNGENLFTYIDRREGIRKAFSLAQEGDVVLITGKGAELTMMVGDRAVPWDERAIVREELHKFSS